MKNIYLLGLGLGLLLLQPDGLLAKGNKHQEERDNDRSYYQEDQERNYDRRRKNKREDRRQEQRYSDEQRGGYDGRRDRYSSDYEAPAQRGGKGLPPGLAKKAAAGKPLPPGWQSKLSAGHPMDDDLRQYSRPLTREQRSMLPKTEIGTTMMQLENKVVKVNDATNTIMEVLELPNKSRR